MVPGAPMDDALIESVGGEPWLLQMLGDRFQPLHCVADAADLDAASVAALQSLAEGPIPLEPIVVAARWLGAGQPAYADRRQGPHPRALRPADRHHLPRPPDQHVAALARLDPAAVRAPSPAPPATPGRRLPWPLNTNPTCSEPGKRYFRAFSPATILPEA